MSRENPSYPQEDGDALCEEKQSLEGSPTFSEDSSMYTAVLDYNGSRMFIKRLSMSAQVSLITNNCIHLQIDIISMAYRGAAIYFTMHIANINVLYNFIYVIILFCQQI